MRDFRPTGRKKWHAARGNLSNQINKFERFEQDLRDFRPTGRKKWHAARGNLSNQINKFERFEQDLRDFRPKGAKGSTLRVEIFQIIPNHSLYII